MVATAGREGAGERFGGGRPGGAGVPTPPRPPIVGAPGWLGRADRPGVPRRGEGPSSPAGSADPAERRARERAGEPREFYSHQGSSIAVNVSLFVLDFVLDKCQVQGWSGEGRVPAPRVAGPPYMGTRMPKSSTKAARVAGGEGGRAVRRARRPLSPKPLPFRPSPTVLAAPAAP